MAANLPWIVKECLEGGRFQEVRRLCMGREEKLYSSLASLLPAASLTFLLPCPSTAQGALWGKRDPPWLSLTRASGEKSSVHALRPGSMEERVEWGVWGGHIPREFLPCGSLTPVLICFDPTSSVVKYKPLSEGDHWPSQVGTGEGLREGCGPDHWFDWVRKSDFSPIHQRKWSVWRSNGDNNLDACHLICCLAISTEYLQVFVSEAWRGRWSEWASARIFIKGRWLGKKSVCWRCVKTHNSGFL